MAALAQRERTTFFEALRRAEDAPAMAARSAKAVAAFVRMMDDLIALNEDESPAVVLEAVGVPREAFTAVFAAGRVAGWIAHVCEQERTGRIIRPQSEYVGPMPADSASAAPAAGS